MEKDLLPKIKITYKRLNAFMVVSGKFLEKNKDFTSQSKIVESVKLVRKFVIKNELADECNDQLEALKLKHASIGSDGNLLIDSKSCYQYTPDAMKLLASESKEIMTDTVEIPARIYPENDQWLSSLTDVEIVAFEGIVISELND